MRGTEVLVFEVLGSESVKQKAWFRIPIMRELKFKLDHKSFETIYLVFIRPLLDCINSTIIYKQIIGSENI